jgi:hypothetical protein
MNIKDWLLINMPTFFGWLDTNKDGTVSDEELAPHLELAESFRIQAKLGDSQQDIINAAHTIFAIPNEYRQAARIAIDAGKLDELLAKSPVAAAMHQLYLGLREVYG